MKRKITFMLAVAASALTMQAQLVFSESFTAPFNPPASGWNVQNLSAPMGSTSWFQGLTNQFPALSGGIPDYFAANFNSTSPVGTNNTISTWLITPTLTLVNGAVIEFATRCSTSPAIFPERLQVYFSTAGTGTNVGTTAGTATNTAGTFTNIVLDINPSLNLWDYPSAWVIYTATLSGIPASTAGRLAFRYYVTNGGNGGSNSNFIGIDDVRYSLPCNFPDVQALQSSLSVCAGSTSSLSINASPAVTSYTWSVGTTTSPAIANPTLNTSPVVVNPTVTTIYILTGESTPGCYSRDLVTVELATPPVVQAQSFTVCNNPVSSVSLTASGAFDYMWSTGATTSSIVVAPNVTTVYTVTGTDWGSSCQGVAEVTVTLGNSLSMGINATNTIICSGWWITLTATGAANNYLWSNGSTASAITVTPNATTTYTVGGLTGACTGSNSVTILVNITPTITAVVSPSPMCAGVTHTFSATGAATYIYDLNNPNPTAIAAPSVTFVPNVTVMSLGVLGTSADGCTSFALLQPTVSPSPTITVLANKTLVCSGSVVTLTASGASTYSWSGAATSTSNPLSFTAGTLQGVQQVSVTGTSTAGCRSTVVTTISVDKCTGIDEQNQRSLSSVVYPNPFSNRLLFSGVEGKVTLCNTLGHLVLQETVSGAQTINTDALPAGVYILTLYDSQGNRERDIKLLKN